MYMFWWDAKSGEQKPRGAKIIEFPHFAWLAASASTAQCAKNNSRWLRLCDKTSIIVISHPERVAGNNNAQKQRQQQAKISVGRENEIFLTGDARSGTDCDSPPFVRQNKPLGC